MPYVISKDGDPLMPCKSVFARLLLKNGKARVVTVCPFVIKLNYETTKHLQNLTLGTDTGSATLGTAVSKDNGDIVYLSEVKLRKDITKNMERRSMYRKTRRNNKTRYREPRFNNRANSTKEDRFSPTIRSKIDSHVKEIEYIKSILPINRVVLEVGQFDTHLMKLFQIEEKPEPLFLNYLKDIKSLEYDIADDDLEVSLRLHFSLVLADEFLKVHEKNGMLIDAGLTEEQQQNLIKYFEQTVDQMVDNSVYCIKGFTDIITEAIQKVFPKSNQVVESGNQNEQTEGK